MGRTAGTAIALTGSPVPTAATGRTATVLAPRVRTVTARTVIGATRAARARSVPMGADQARSEIVRVVRARTGTGPMPIAAAGPVHVVRVRTVVARHRIGIALVVRVRTGADQARSGTAREARVRTVAGPMPIAAAGPVRVVRVHIVVVRRRIGTARVARTVVVRRRVGIALVATARTGSGLTPIAAVGPVRVVRVPTGQVRDRIGRVVRIVVVRRLIGIGRVVRVRTVEARLRIGTVRVGKLRTAVSQAPIVIVPRTTSVETSEIARRMGLPITIAVAEMVIAPTEPDRIAIPPTGNVRAVKATMATGRPLLVRPAVAALPTGAASAPIGVGRRGSGRSGRAAAGHPMSEYRDPTGIGRLRIRAPRTDRSADLGSSGTIVRARTETRRAAARMEGTDRQVPPTVRTRNARTRNARTRNARRTGPTNGALHPPTAAVRPTIVAGARRVIGRGATTAGPIDRAATTVTRAVPSITATTGRPARERTSVSAPT